MQPPTGTPSLASVTFALALALTPSLTACSSTHDGASGSSTTAPATSSATAAPPATSATSAIPTAAPTATGASVTASKGPPRDQRRYVEAAAWSPAGDKLAVWCAGACLPAPGALPTKGPQEPRMVHLVDLPGGAARSVEVLSGDETPIRAVSFSPRGSLLLTSIESITAAYKVADLSQVWKIERPAVYDMFSASPDDSRIAAVDAYGFAEVTDLASKQVVTQTSLHDPNSGRNGVIVWAPSGDRVVLGCDECAPELWGMKGKRVSRYNIEGATWTQSGVHTRPDGLMVVADTSGAVALFDPMTGKAKAVVRKAAKSNQWNAEPGLFSALSADGKLLLVARRSLDVAVLDLDAKTETVLLQGEAVPFFWNGAFSPDGSLIALADHEKIRVVTAATKSVTATLTGTLAGITADNTVVVRAKDGDVYGWSSGREKWRVLAGPSPEPEVDLSPDRKVVSIANGALTLVRSSDGKTASLSLEPRSTGLTLAPTAGTAPTDVSAVLGR